MKMEAWRTTSWCAYAVRQLHFQTEMTTDPQGKFEFDGLALSTYHLTIEGQGIRPYESYLDVSMSHMAYEQITLQFG